MLTRLLKLFKQQKIDHLPVTTGNQEELTPLPRELVTAIPCLLRQKLGDSNDLHLRQFSIGKSKALLAYIDGLADIAYINRMLEHLMDEHAGVVNASRVKEHLWSAAHISEHEVLEPALTELLLGNALLALEGADCVFTADAKAPPGRAVEDPVTESLIRGPRDGFTENLRCNTALLRRRLPTPDLRISDMKIGKLTKTKVSIAWLQDIADQDVVQELQQRLSRIEIDGVLESGYLEEFIEDNHLSPFPQLQYTERPDVVAASLLEGRVAVLTDNTPFALLAPISFWQLLQVNEDYYERPLIGSFLRLLRFAALLVSLFLPAFYVAATTYHQEMIPTQLALSIAGAREGIPFPALIEALLMITAFEALREAGLRLPKPTGEAISIVGSLIVGLAAVEAGLASPAMIIVVAGTAIASFVLPFYGLAIAIRLIRYPLLIAAGLMGLYGVLIVSLTLALHLCSLRSLGAPYMSPVAPLNLRDLKDTAVRFPLWSMYSRPWISGRLNRKRQQHQDYRRDKPE